MPNVCPCQRGLHVNVLVCYRGLRANVLVCHLGLRVNVTVCQRAKIVQTPYFYIPTCQTCHEARQCFNLACQCAKWCASFSIWCTNVPKVCQSFKHSCYEMLKEISILYHYMKNSTLYLVS